MYVENTASCSKIGAKKKIGLKSVKKIEEWHDRSNVSLIRISRACSHLHHPTLIPTKQDGYPIKQPPLSKSRISTSRAVNVMKLVWALCKNDTTIRNQSGLMFTVCWKTHLNGFLSSTHKAPRQALLQIPRLLNQAAPSCFPRKPFALSRSIFFQIRQRAISWSRLSSKCDGHDERKSLLCSFWWQLRNAPSSVRSKYFLSSAIRDSDTSCLKKVPNYWWLLHSFSFNSWQGTFHSRTILW